MKTVIYHSADFDGLFCREIAKKFLGTDGVQFIGWDHGQPPVSIPAEGQIFIMDLPCDTVFGLKFGSEGHQRWLERTIWIDHHKSAIETHNPTIQGYRIDGVAACRLAWQWFTKHEKLFHPTAGSFAVPLPDKQAFIDRMVEEPLSVRMAGEYDVWDKRDDRVDQFQLGLRSKELDPADWFNLLSVVKNLSGGTLSEAACAPLVATGKIIQRYQNEADASKMKSCAFLLEFEGLKFLALNSPAKSSMQFASMDVPETGHDALMKFNFNGKVWDFSLYHAAHRKDIDLSKIAVKLGGGGHAGACGFRTQDIAFGFMNGSKTLNVLPL